MTATSSLFQRSRLKRLSTSEGEVAVVNRAAGDAPSGALQGTHLHPHRTSARLWPRNRKNGHSSSGAFRMPERSMRSRVLAAT